MRSMEKKLLCYSRRNNFLREINSRLSCPPKSKNICTKLHSCTKRLRRKKFDKAAEGNRASCLDDGDNGKNGSGCGVSRRAERKRQKRKKKKKSLVKDEASCLQRRARYMLIKMKLELNLIDAYSGDGWKGQSKEKIKPEKELQRAEKQVLKCKLGIRDTIRQLDLLSSEGRIADALMSPDGSVLHEHIFCAKCKLGEAFPDNDIILCDGICNCAFHQKCLEPPLEKIPPADQGWLCKICECKMEILEAINAHVGTSYTMDSSWEDIFKEATTTTNNENTSSDPDEKWPSEDSNDEDYDPELIENSNSRMIIEESMSDDASSSRSFFCSSDEIGLLNSTIYQQLDLESNKDLEHVDSLISIDAGKCSDHEIISYRRKRRDVDYRKLHDEMFGKELNENVSQSEDEDWGPRRKKRRRRELDTNSTMQNIENEDGCCKMVAHQDISHNRRKLFRIPHDAVQKLRQVFVKNELPSRAIKENLALELGISAEKISKWFKNTRYAALKSRKAEMTDEPLIADSTKSAVCKSGKQISDGEESMDSSDLLPLSSIVRVPKNLTKIIQRKNTSKSNPLKKLHKVSDNVPTEQNQKVVSKFPFIRSCCEIEASGIGNNFKSCCEIEASGIRNNFTSEDTSSKVGRADTQVDEIAENERLCLVELYRVFSLEERLKKLKITLLTCTDCSHVPNKTHPQETNVVYVPIAEVKERSLKNVHQ